MGDKTVRKSNPITRFLILIVVRIPEKTFVVDVWEKETAFTKLLKRTTAGGEEIIECWFEERERERGLFLDCGVDGWMDGSNKQKQIDRGRERERERERPFLFLFYIGLIEEKYAITAAAALSCVVLWYDNERIINRGQERWGKEWDDRQAQQKNWD